MSPQPIVRIRNLQKSYGDLAVLRGLDADIERGSKVAIIGPSGSGKSTLLRLLMTLERPDAGTIEIGGEPLWMMDRRGQSVPASEVYLRRIRDKIGMVFQQFNLFPHMSVLRNVALAPEIVHGLSRKEAEEQGRALLAKVGLADKADSLPAQLSGGQQQRVAIARALAKEPEIMLFDEVTSALDPELIGEVLEVLRQLARESDISMIIVTHETQFAREIGERILFFDEGKILEDADPETMFTNPSQQRTREFLQRVLES